MQSLPKTKFSWALIRSSRISYQTAFIVGIVLLLLLLPFLAFPVRSAAVSQPQVIKLDGHFTLNFLFPVQRDEIQIDIYPEVDLDRYWDGVIFNQKLHLKPKHLLYPNQIYKIKVRNVKNPIGSSVSEFDFTFRTESFPEVINFSPDPAEGKVGPNQAFEFALDKEVDYGEFKLVSDPPFKTDVYMFGRRLRFFPKDSLKQGEEYKVSLLFTAPGLMSSQLFNATYLVVTPLKITGTTPAQNVKNTSKKSEIIFTFDKILKEVRSKEFVKIEPSIEGEFSNPSEKIIKFTPKDILPTNTNFEVTVAKNIQAEDGAMLEKDFVLKFKTAGPVKVESVSPQGWGVSLNPTISITFDQKIDKKTAQERFAISPKVNGSFSWSGNTMYFVPSVSLSLFQQYGFSLAIGIIGPGGEPSEKAFSYGFKTTLERQRTIGTTPQGRGITAYYFGVGAKKILLVGSMHGSEANTGSLLTQWANYLRINQSKIPTDRTFIIVPYANPDGVVTEDRFNSRKVDLNRNFDTPTWQPDTYWNGGVVKNGGGKSPFSESEARALRDLILQENPRITISYHSAAGVVVSDGASNSLRDWYANKSGYTKVAGTPLPAEEVFSYEVTGSLEEWLGERNKIVIVVELATFSLSEFDRNLPALEGLFTYPI